jgi:predicted ATPase
MIPEAERPAAHHRIGRHLLHRMTVEDQVDSYVFEICNQLNKAQGNLSPEESGELIGLNLRAGRKALRATAFDGATEYFGVARNLLGEDSWQRRRQVTLDVYLANVERLFAATEYADGIITLQKALTVAIALVEEVLKHTLLPAESIPFLLKRLDCEMSMGNPGRAFVTGLRFDLEMCV